MFEEQLKRVLNLIKKTGDRVVVFDSVNPDNSYLIMDISAYEKMWENRVANGIMDKKENELELDKKTEDFVSPNQLSAFKPKDLTDEDLTDKINREISMWKNQENPSFLSEEDKAKKPWAIPSQIKEKAKEVE